MKIRKKDRLRSFTKKRENKARQTEQLNHLYSMLVHEMRSPLSLLKAHMASMSDQPSWINLALEQLEGAVNDLLSLSQISAHKMVLQAQPIDLAGLVRDFNQLGRLEIRDKPIELSIQNDSSIQHIIGDGFRLKQILFNLLSNAIKFTEQGLIKLCFNYNANTACLEIQVKDSGIGMTQQQQKQLGQPFTQFLQGASQGKAGTGLGLFIVYQLVRLMNGQLQLRSEVGKGTEFNLVFPMSIAQPVQMMNSNKADSRSEGILIVDDSELILHCMQHEAIQAGLLVDVARSQTEAEERFQQCKHAVVIVDYRLGKTNGIELIERLDAMQTHPTDIRFFLMSAEPIPQKIRPQLIEAVLLKPVKIEQLLELLGDECRNNLKKVEKSLSKIFLHGKIPSE